MCEMPTLFNAKTRKARIEHKCCECGVVIAKGDSYRYSQGLWDGRFSSFKQCLNCHEIMEAAAKTAYSEDESPGFTGLLDWFQNSQCRGFTGTEWLNGMAQEIGLEPEKLNRLLNV